MPEPTTLNLGALGLSARLVIWIIALGESEPVRPPGTELAVGNGGFDLAPGHETSAAGDRFREKVSQLVLVGIMEMELPGHGEEPGVNASACRGTVVQRFPEPARDGREERDHVVCCLGRLVVDEEGPTAGRLASDGEWIERSIAFTG